MKFKWITIGNAEYDSAKMLRWEILLKPLGLCPETKEISEEIDSLHLIALDNKKVVGSVVFSLESKMRGRMYQMVISEEYRKEKFGRKLLSTLEKELGKKGVYYVYLYAYKEVEGFYQQMGYQSEGPTIEKIGIPHQLMSKTLPNQKKR
ncbi:MAG: GNAT family N-acetyltransferase [Chlamydiales bacterium]|jgi:N-acetylglutamate synthase-like GNAT family acetyltransferase|nr:GNAT family N-acetyltransferase [Chlamydiales bacterium]